jgi:hypothetical protein
VRVIRGAGMWTAENRVRYERKGLRYESDLTIYAGKKIKGKKRHTVVDTP